MKIVLLSTPDERAGEVALVEKLFAAGLERFHLRKPGWKSEHVALWLESMPARWRGRMVLHAHAELASSFRVGGIHFRDDGNAPEDPAPRVMPGCRTSRSCHDVVSVKAALGRYDSVLFAPVFASISKPGYGPVPGHLLEELRTLLANRRPEQERTQVFALGGVTTQRLHECRSLGFDGVALLGAVWDAADPLAAFKQIQHANTPSEASPPDRSLDP